MIKSLINLIAICASIFVITSSSSARAQQPQVREWTILVYMNSDNNLWRYGQLNMAEMEKIGSSPHVNVVVQQDPEPAGMPTTRYYVTQNPNPQPGKPTSKVLETMGETDMGNWKTLAEFLVWGAKTFPARHYAVIVWNHGSGWKGISYDDNPSNYISTPALAKAVQAFNQVVAPAQRGLRAEAGPMVDIINFDACLMSTLEVAYELRSQAKILVGSQFLEPGEGEDYSAFLKPLVANPKMSAADFAQILVYQYVLRYKDSPRDINYIALDLSKMGAFTQAFAKVATNMVAAPTEVQNNLKKAYGTSSYGFDLIGGMQTSLQVGSSVPALVQSLDALLQMYGYPQEVASRVRNGANAGGKVYNIVRHYPGVVYYRYDNSQQWKTVRMTAGPNGFYGIQIPASAAGGQLQYTVMKTNFAGNAPMAREALSVIAREGDNPIVFHNKFPASSPVIADAYTHRTKGAHGMSLYAFSSMDLARRGQRELAGSVKEQYKQLQFAVSGAPDWTRFFGF